MHLSAYTSTLCVTLALLAGCGDDKGGTITTDDDLSGPGSTSTTSETTNPTTSTTGTTGATGDTGTSLASDTTLADTTDATGTTGTTTTGDTGTTSTTGTTGTTDASTTGGGGLGEGEVCQDNPDGCAPGLLCCYPCGIPDCMNKCIKPDPNTQSCPLFP